MLHIAKLKPILEDKFCTTKEFYTAKLKPILENKYQSKMDLKLGIYWVAIKAKTYPRE